MVYPRGLLRFGEEQQPQVCTGMSFRHCSIAVNHCDGKNPPRKAHQSTEKPLAEQCPPPLRQHHGNQPAPAKFQPCYGLRHWSRREISQCWCFYESAMKSLLLLQMGRVEEPRLASIAPSHHLTEPKHQFALTYMNRAI